MQPASSKLRYSAQTILFLLSMPLWGQWTKLPAAGIPRTASGDVNLAAPAPRTRGGKPDLSGIWEPQENKYVRNIAADLKPDQVPFQPWAKALYDQRTDGSHSKEDPDANCLPQGVPKIDAAPAPWKIVQAPASLVIIYEAFTLWRQVFMDGRERAADLNPTWLGYSLGKWDGDTLVVDTRGFNGKIWLDQLGKPSTEALHVIERFHRKDYGHMDLTVTIDDPKAYTRAWTVTEPVHLLPDTELIEFICNENNRDIPHLPGQ
ncbi:MAG TPA: hypothetical protein VKT49_15935 [Bryobacteraceae bacterium]|nr:hypothetical protein [Bryobacteraceae bacterium]